MSTPSSSTRSSPRKRPPAQQPPAVSAHGTPSGKDSREKESDKEGGTQSRKEKDRKDSQSQSKDAADGHALTNPQTTPRRSRQTERSNTKAKAEEIKCRLLGQIRELRDRRETSLKRRFGEPTSDRAEGAEPVTKKPSTLQGREEIPASLEDLNNFVEKLEREKTGGKVFEELISDPKYKTAIFQQPIIKSTHSGDKKTLTASPRKTFDPIAVKVEEGTSAAAANASSAISHSLLIENNCQRELKQENQIMSRIAELRRQGLWSSSRLPLCVEPPRSKTHWDFLLEEMKWMATDFRQERNLKKAVARRLSWTIARLKKEEELEVERAEQRVIKEGKRIAGAIAKMVDEFWRNVDKVVEYRAQEIIKSRKRRAQAQHLEFIVGEATKLSSLVHEGLVAERTSKTPSIASKDDLENDAEFGFSGSESDDESTIAQAEKAMKEEDVSSELKSLEKEAGQDLDDLFASLPPEYLESLGIKLPQTDTAPSTSKIAEEEEESGPSTRRRRGSTSRDTVVKQKPSGGKETAISAEEQPMDNIDVDETTKDSTLTQGTGTEASTSPEGVEKGDSQARHPEAEGNGDGRGVLENVNYDKLQSENSEDRQRELSNIAEEALKFQPKGYTLDTTQVKTQVPFLIRGQLREYQMVGLDWLVTLYENNLNGILADEMGLGKTIQTIALLAHLACSERIWGPHLIVVPTSVILNWEMELKKWCPALKILTYFGGQKERQEKRKGWNRPHQFHVCITSYKTVTTDIRSFKMKAWQYLILDEAQNIKNWKSQRWQALLNVRARRRLLLTGTPLQNSLMELWSLLHFLMPAVFGSHDDFKDWFSNPLTGMMDGSVEYNQALVDRLHKVLRPFILRRLKCEVEKQLPEKTEKVIKCPLSKRQRYLYDDFMSRRSTKENLKTGNMMSVLNIVMQLRKCCNHPNLFEPRPVVAPFILTPRHMAYPAMLMDLCREDEDVRDDEKKQIPQGLIIANRFTGWAMNTPARHSAPLIEELEQWAEGKRPPKVDGFRFQRPPWDKKQLPPSSASSSQAPAVVNISSAELERAGFGENEMFLVVKEGDDLESLLSNSEGAPVPMRVRVENGRVVLDTEQVQPQQIGKTRLCQEVTGQNGEKTLREVSPSRAPAAAIPPQSSKAVTATTSHDNCPPSDGIPTATLLGTGAGPSTSHQEISSYPQIVTYKSLMQQGRQPLVAHPSLRSQVVRHDDQPSRQPNTPSGGFHDTMTNGGTRDSINNPNYKFSPPLKKRKRDTSPLIKGEYADYVPDYVLSNLTEEMKKRLELAAARFATSTQTTPIFSNQLIDALQHEFRVVKRHPPNIFNRDIFAAAETHEDIRERLAENAEWITRKFPLFIDAAQCDAVHFSSTSSGRLAYRRLEDTQAELITRQVLEGEHKLTDAVLLARKLQFPELRLIEYDCGKLQILANLLRELYLYKHRVLIFTQMSRMLDVLQAFLSYHGYQYFRLDGTTGVEQRQAMMERFNADPKVFCFILSTRSGGIGVNLTGADTVVFYDSDWNPTMDAQAQDRCHRIGQTRNVTIYRLISERTIEENILKKAMQKRRLGEMAIDEAGFTPDFFKKADNIRDLFDGEQAVADIVREVNEQDAPRDQKELEKAMASLEDEQDVTAAKIAAAEARADRAEFEEAAKTGTAVSLLGSVDEQADEKYLELINQLKPIERYAINVLETEYKPEFEEELREAEIAIDAQKEEWQRSHERAMDSIEGEEDVDADGDMSSKAGGRKSARATQDGGNLEDDFYIGGNLIDEILAEGPEPFANAFMPVWMPPTPPLSDGPYQDEFDVYVDESFDLIYELDPMNEARLPSTIYELHKPFIKPPSPRKEVHHHPPRYHTDSGDHPTTTNISGLYKGPGTSGGIDKSEFDVYGIADFETPKSEAQEPRTSVSRRDRQRLPPTRPQDPTRRLEAPPAAPPPFPEREELDYEGPEWTIIEDMELLNAIRAEEAKGHQLYRHKDSGLMYNWEIIANLVNRVSDFYRSPRQCSLRYQLAIRPREQGLTIAYDPVTMKQRKISVSQVELSHMRKGRATTELMYEHDASRIQSNKWINRFKLIRQQIARHLTAFRRGTFDEHIVKSVRGELPSDQEAKLTSLGVNYHNPVDLDHIIKAQEERAYDHQVKQTDKRKAERVPSEERPPTPPPMFIVSRKNAVPVDPKDYKPIVRQPLFMEMLPISPPAPFPPTPQQLAQMQQPPQRLQTLQQQIQGQGSSQIAMQGLAQGQTVQQQAPQDAQPLLPRRTGSVPSALQQLPSQPNVAVSQSMSTAASSSIAAGTAPHGYVVVTGPQSSSAGETKSETVRLQPLPSRLEPGTTQSGSMPPSTAPQAIYRSIQPSQVSNQGQQAGSVGAGAGGQVTGIIQQVKRAPGQGTQMQIGRTPVAYMAASGGQGQGQQIGNVYSTQIVVQQGRGQAQAQGADGVRRPVQRVAGPQPGRMYTSGERFVVATGASQAQQAGGQAHTQMRLVASGQRIAAAGQGQGQPIQVGITQAGVVGTTIQTQKRIHQQGPITAGMMLQRAPGQQGNPQQIRGSPIQGRYAQQPRIMVTNTGTGQIRQAVPPGQHAQAGTGTMRQILSRGPMTGAGGQVIARGSGGSPQTVGVLLAPPPTTSSSSADPTSNASSPAPSASSPLSGGPPMLQPQVRTSSPMHQKQGQQSQQQDGQG